MTANPTYTPEIIAGAKAMALELNPFADPDIGIEDFAKAFAAALEAMLPVSDELEHVLSHPASFEYAIRYITGATDDLG